MSIQEASWKPVVLIRVGGKEATEIMERLIAFEYTDRIRKRDSCRMVFDDRDRRLVDELLQPNDVWEVRWGYPGNLSSIRVLTLVSWSAPFDNKAGQVTVDLKVTRGKLAKTTFTSEMHRVRLARNWGKIQSSEIAKKVAKRYRLRAIVQDSDDVGDADFVQSENITDYEYLQQLAYDIDFECFIENNTLYYRPKPYEERPRRVLTYYPAAGESLLKSFTAEVKVVSTSTKPSTASSKNTPPKRIEDITNLRSDENDRLADIATSLQGDVTIAQESYRDEAAALRKAQAEYDAAVATSDLVQISSASNKFLAARVALQSAASGRDRVFQDAASAIRDVQDAIVRGRQEELHATKKGDKCVDQSFSGQSPTGDHPSEAGREVNLVNGAVRQIGDAQPPNSPGVLIVPIGLNGVAHVLPLEDVVKSVESHRQKAQKIACAAHSRRRDKAVEASATLIGDPALRAKVTYLVKIPSRRLEGNWYATEAVHAVATSYEVRMKLKRGALKLRGKGKGKGAKTDPTPRTVTTTVRNYSLVSGEQTGTTTKTEVLDR